MQSPDRTAGWRLGMTQSRANEGCHGQIATDSKAGPTVSHQEKGGWGGGGKGHTMREDPDGVTSASIRQHPRRNHKMPALGVGRALSSPTACARGGIAHRRHPQTHIHTSTMDADVDPGRPARNSKPIMPRHLNACDHGWYISGAVQTTTKKSSTNASLARLVGGPHGWWNVAFTNDGSENAVD